MTDYCKIYFHMNMNYWKGIFLFNQLLAIEVYRLHQNLMLEQYYFFMFVLQC